MGTSERRPEEGKGASHVDVWGLSVPGRGNTKCSGPEAETCLAWPADTKEAGVSGVGEEVGYNGDHEWGDQSSRAWGPF